MKANQHIFSLCNMCDVLEVSKSGYFEWLHYTPTCKQKENAEITKKIIEYHAKNRQSYGYRRMHSELAANGIVCGIHRVSRLMKRAEIKVKTVKKFKATTDSKHHLPIFENHLNREFNPSNINERWCGDITYIWTQEGWLYLATVIDLYSRRVIGWSLNERMTDDLVLKALNMALHHRNIICAPFLMWHSDRGSQYASHKYRGLLLERGLKGSMSRKGNCWDNAVAESFFSTLKKELIHHDVYETRERAAQSIFEYIEVFYNRQRRHSTLGYVSPAEYERLNAAA